MKTHTNDRCTTPNKCPPIKVARECDDARKPQCVRATDGLTGHPYGVPMISTQV